MYIKSENIEWWLSSQSWFEVNNWICWIKCFNLSTCLPVALDQGKSTGGTSLLEGSTALHEVEAVGFNQSKIVSKSWKRFGFGSVPLEHHKTSGTRKQYEFQALSDFESNYILKQNGVEKKNDRKVKPQLILYLYPTHAYPKPSALAFHSIKMRSTYTRRGRFLLTGFNCVTIIVSQSLCHNHCVTSLLNVWEKTVLLVKNTFHDDSSPDDKTSHD